MRVIRVPAGLIMCGGVTLGGLMWQADDTFKFEPQEIARDFGVGYAVVTADMNGDKRLDVLAINETRLVWFENPSWDVRVLVDGKTPKDNVTLAPLDIDGDGRLDVALGAGWNPRDTNGGGTLHWVQQPNPRDATASWAVRDISSEPTLHRIRWANVDGAGPPELVVTPLHGRGTTPPEWNERGARVLVHRIPSKPADEPWPAETADDTLHILHNFAVVDFDADGRDELLTASREGVHLLRRSSDGQWTRTRLGEGAPGEIKVGRIAGRRVLATVEPWHGTSVVVYLEPVASARSTGSSDARSTAPPEVWERHVIEDQIAGGHALGWADFDGDGDDELAVGWRDKAFGLALYDVMANGALRAKVMIDAGGIAVEDLTIADLDVDGRPDIIASGRKTSNVRIYWNRTVAQPRAGRRKIG
jgi:hypothetical protein